MTQWPLPMEKLLAAYALIEEQLQTGHIEPSLSPWNTPVFVIKKKSGKRRLLQDLREVNVQMYAMGPVQRGLPLLSAIPRDWPLLIIDIKDCFFFLYPCMRRIGSVLLLPSPLLIIKNPITDINEWFCLRE